MSKIVSGSNANQRVSAMLCGIFFFSGVAALMFETLWFRQAGLTFGNSVWASAVVLASFMGGMALGNGLAAVNGRRVTHPILWYVRAEIAVAISGVLLVCAFPLLTQWLAPLFRLFLDSPALLNGLRLTISFALMMIPATAMGITLPLLVKALYVNSPSFGVVLGRLYGWNTLGAVAGAVLAEAVCIGSFGVRGTGLVAGSLNVACAAAALWVGKSHAWTADAHAHGSTIATSAPTPWFQGARILCAGFLSGGILLALEVIWFRFLILFFNGYSLAFAIMLAVVLAGIGLGGMLASLWFRFRPHAHRYLFAMALVSGAVSIAVYAFFRHGTPAPSSASAFEWTYMVSLSIPLIFPVSLLSGILFTMIGQSAYDEIRGSIETTGLLTMLNTSGAMMGSLLAGLVLLPALGMEKSLYVLSLCYGGVALCVARKDDFVGLSRHTILNGVAAVVFVVCIIRFPFGAMEQQILSVGKAYFHGSPGWEPVAIREGLTETSQYWQKRWLGNLLYTRLFTNNHPMSCTANQARRYMNDFVYWPVAVHPNPRSALLICFGVGSTAKALTDTKRLQSIDVVDISPDILANSALIFPHEKDNPLHDPRVTVHVEDGRFFLQTTPRRFDIITAEPPPPLAAGVVNLYSQEYFQLIYDRLHEGGIVTYWLPSWQIPWSATQSIVKAFCNVFHDCSLWTGTAFDWMLVGSRGPAGPVSETRFEEQWHDPVVGPQLREYGFEQPGQMAATFIMDAASLREWTKDSLPIVDNFPKRIFGKPSDVYEYTLPDLEEVMSAHRCQDRFLHSPFVASLWPEPFRKKSLEYFRFQSFINSGFVHPVWADFAQNMQSLHDVLTLTSLRYPVLLAMGGPEFPDVDRVLSEIGAETAGQSPGTGFSLGVKAMADRDYLNAAKYFGEEQQEGRARYAAYYRVYALCMADRIEEARKIVRDRKDLFAGKSALDYVVWLTQTFGF